MTNTQAPQPTGHCVMGEHPTHVPAVSWVGPHPACAPCATEYLLRDLAALDPCHPSYDDGRSIRAARDLSKIAAQILAAV